MKMYICFILYLQSVSEKYGRSVIFKDNDHIIIYAFILMLFFKIVTQRSRTLIPLMPLFKTFWKTSSPNCLLNHLQAWLKTSISLLSIRILYQDSSCFFFYSPELAINVSVKWWKWLKLTFKLWNLSPLRIFRNVYACVWYRLRKQFLKEGEILWIMAEL